MKALEATQARKTNEAESTEAETLVFEGRALSQTGKQTMEPGEFYFRPTAIPIIKEPHSFKKAGGPSHLGTGDTTAVSGTGTRVR